MAHPRVDAIVEQARAAVAAAQTSSELEAIRVGVLGRQGSLTQLLRSLGTLAPEERPLVGAAANEAKRELEGLLDARLAATSRSPLALVPPSSGQTTTVVSSRRRVIRGPAWRYHVPASPWPGGLVHGVGCRG